MPQKMTKCSLGLIMTPTPRGVAGYIISIFMRPCTYLHNWPRAYTRAVLSPGNRGNFAKSCKLNFDMYSQWGTSYGRYSDRQRKLAFSTTALSFDTTSPANPDEYRHNSRNHRPWATPLLLTVYTQNYASSCILKQSCLNTRAC